MLLERPEVAAGDLDTGLIARVFDDLDFPEASERTFAEAALVLHAFAARDSATHGSAGGSAASGSRATGPWARGDGWRLGPAAPGVYELTSGGQHARVRVWHTPLRVAVGDAEPRDATARVDEDVASIGIDGLVRTFPVAREGSDAVWLHADGSAARVAETRIEHGADAAADASPTVTSPLPGTVVMVTAVDGSTVEVGDPVVAVEAMKMEHVLRAQVAGVVRLRVAVGDQVTRGGVVATIEVSPTAAE